MKKQILLSLLLVTGFASVQNLLGTQIYEFDQNNADQMNGYNFLKEMVLERMGATFALDFNARHSTPSKEAVEELLFHFDQNPDFKINIEDYNILKEAVFNKMGQTFASSFESQYLMPTKKSVEELAHHFDHPPSFWFLSNPPQTTAVIGGKQVEIQGHIGDIIYDLLHE